MEPQQQPRLKTIEVKALLDVGSDTTEPEVRSRVKDMLIFYSDTTTGFIKGVRGVKAVVKRGN